MKTVKAAAVDTASGQYQISDEGCHNIANTISSATHEICVYLHQLQCDEIGKGFESAAVRVEKILQLQALSLKIQRIGFTTADRIAQPKT